jgi:ElaB/YqjD/DUF883 family membrane-anchored ribosome-binding protein
MKTKKVKAKVMSNLDKAKAGLQERRDTFNKGYKTGTKAIAKSDSVIQSTGIATGAVVGLCAHVVHEAVSFLPSVSRA